MMEAFSMSKYFPVLRLRAASTVLLAFIACVSLSFAQAPRPGKVIGGYFEEWGIHYGGFTIADLQRNGVADELTHLIYAFGDVTPLRRLRALSRIPPRHTWMPPCAV